MKVFNSGERIDLTIFHFGLFSIKKSLGGDSSDGKLDIESFFLTPLLRINDSFFHSVWATNTHTPSLSLSYTHALPTHSYTHLHTRTHAQMTFSEFRWSRAIIGLKLGSIQPSLVSSVCSEKPKNRNRNRGQTISQKLLLSLIFNKKKFPAKQNII